ncbi:MAG: alanine racemase [Dehalococcoidia bacterium]
MNNKPQIGTHIYDLDTPCLIIELDKLEANMNYVSNFYATRSSKMRPHAKNHKTPAIAHMQINIGGTVGGVCASKVSEAEVMVNNGIKSVLITSEIVDSLKISRMTSLAKRAEINVAIDNLENAKRIDLIANTFGVQIGLIIEIETGMGRCGVQNPNEALDLAHGLKQLKNVSLNGLMSHQTISGEPDLETRHTEAKKIIDKVITTKNLLESEGYALPIISTGETWSYDVAADIDGVTEIQGGSYLLMETDYAYMTEFEQVCKVIGTVTSKPDSSSAIINIGLKHISSLRGVPTIEQHEDIQVINMTTSNSTLSIPDGSKIKVGDQLAFIPSQQDAMVSRWNEFIGIRGEFVESIWDIEARGCIS